MDKVLNRVRRTVDDIRARVPNVPNRTPKQLRHDIEHIFEATVEVVDTEYWRRALPFVEATLKYPTPQKYA